MTKAQENLKAAKAALVDLLETHEAALAKLEERVAEAQAAVDNESYAKAVCGKFGAFRPGQRVTRQEAVYSGSDWGRRYVGEKAIFGTVEVWGPASRSKRYIYADIGALVVRVLKKDGTSSASAEKLRGWSRCE